MKYRDLQGASLIEKAANFIIPFEGFQPTPYWDVRQWSIGYGFGCGYDKNHKPNLTWTKEQAKNQLMARLNDDLTQTLMNCTKPLSDAKKVALLSFNYNLGAGNTQKILDRINQGMNDAGVTAAMNQYVIAGGKVSQTLVNRRAAEVSMFLS